MTDQALQSIPYFDQWFGYWLMHEGQGRALLQFVRSLDLSMHVQQVTINQSEYDEEGSVKPPRSEKWSGTLGAQQREIVRIKNGYDYEIADGVALAELSGRLMKHQSSGQSTSTIMMRRTVREMRNDERVRSAIIRIDSPGGTVAGAYDLADEIALLAAAKPTHAYIEDLGASAAYLQAAQMTSISANANAEVGSIGTVGVVYDSSAAAAMEGIRVHVLRGQINGKPAPMKGAGAPGSEITPDQLARWQEEIDDLNEQFLQAVMRGRKMSRDQVEAVADGGVWIAPKAQSRKLIDRVEPLDALFERSRSGNGSTTDRRTLTHSRDGAPSSAAEELQHQIAAGIVPVAESHEQSMVPAADAGATGSGSIDPGATATADTPPKETPMSQPTTAAAGTSPAPVATKSVKEQTADLEAACPGAPSDFILEQLRQGATPDQATRAFVQFQQTKISALNDDLAKAQQTQAQQSQAGPATGKTGVKPIGTAPAEQSAVIGAGGDAVEQFSAAVEEQMQKPGYSDRKKAIAQVCRTRPELHKAYLLASNPSSEHRQRINDKYVAA